MSLADTAKDANYAFHDIPVIDMQTLRDGDSDARRALASQIRDACINVGFFYVSNHGILDNVLEDALSAAKQFFDLPLEDKMKLESKKSPSFMGYEPVLSSNNDPNNQGDLHEGFEFGWEDIEASESQTSPATIGKNVWPDIFPAFRPAALQYYHAAVAFGRLLFPLFALALNLPEHYFSDKTKDSAALMRLLYYPPQTGPVDEKIIGIGAHTDWECFTILWQEPGIQALQVLNASKEWINAPPIPGTLVINLGDQFARWTNDIFKSTVHRAVNRNGVKRYSIPVFFGTDYDVPLEPIPGCVSPDRPPKYEVITAGEYVKSRFSATYGR